MAITKAAIESFVQGKTMALVGISAGGKGFGNSAYKELKARGYRVLPVHPTASTIQGDPCWPSLSRLPEPVERLLVVTAPSASEAIVKEATAMGIRHVWLQQGAESTAAIKAGEDQGVHVVHGQCILMFAEGTRGAHAFHRWLWKVLGKIPKA